MTSRVDTKHGGLPTGGSSGTALLKQGLSSYDHAWGTNAFGLVTGQMMLASSASETDFLKCDGSLYLRSSYPSLAAVIGTPILLGPETTTFFNNSQIDSPYVWDANGVIFSAGTVSTSAATSGNLLTSADGTTWTARTAYRPASDCRTQFAHNGTTYVGIVGIGGMQSSAALSTWTRTLVNTPAQAYEVAFGGTGNRFISVGYTTSCCGNIGVLSYSSSGTSWTAATHGFTNETIISVAASSSNIVAIGSSGTLRYSADGSTAWTAVTITGQYGVPSRVSYANSLFIMTTSNGHVYSSANGVTWTLKGQSVPSSKVFWNGTVYLCTGGASSKISADLITWIKASTVASAVLSSKFWGRKALGTVFSVDTNSYNSGTHFPVPNFTTSGGNITGAYQTAQAWIKT